MGLPGTGRGPPRAPAKPPLLPKPDELITGRKTLRSCRGAPHIVTPIIIPTVSPGETQTDSPVGSQQQRALDTYALPPPLRSQQPLATPQGFELQEAEHGIQNLQQQLKMMWTNSSTSVDITTTATEMYMEVTNVTKDKLLERLRRILEIQGGNEQFSQGADELGLKKKVDNFFMKLCYQSLLVPNEIDEDDALKLATVQTKNLIDTCNLLQLPSEETISAFLVQKTLWEPNGVKRYISFPHKDIKDFYSALYVKYVLEGYNKKFDASGIESDIREVLQNHNFPFVLSNNIMAAVQNVIQKKSTILDVLVDMDKKKVSNTSDSQIYELRSYKNVLIHFAGVLSMDGNDIDKSIAKEIVSLLYESGIDSDEDWFELFNKVTLHQTLATCIARKHLLPQSFSEETIIITDDNVNVFAYILSFLTPTEITVVIKKDPHKILKLHDTIKALEQHNKCEMKIYLSYTYHHPEFLSISLDNALQSIFKR